MITQKINADVFKLDCGAEIDRICQAIRTHVKRLGKRGVVLGLSGGIDSSVVGALCVKALGPKRVFGLLMPERDSNQETMDLGQMMVDHLGIEAIVENISSTLEAVGCYVRRDEAIQSVIPEYTLDYQCKIVSPGLLDAEQYRLFSVVVQSPDGQQQKERLPMSAYLQIVAASNFKQRIRKMLEYYHADRLNYAVMGTPNRLEYDQGFFVKQGDGAADIKPIAHLYKTQVYHLAAEFGLPQPVQEQEPTTDTYSMSQNQEEFFFGLPYDKMDLCLYGINNDIPAEALCEALGCTEEQVEYVYKDIQKKRRTTEYLHLSPILMESVKQIHSQVE